MSSADDARGSEVPANLVREREAFVRTFLKKGVEYTEALLKENGELREELSEARSDVARLRAQMASEDAIRDLLRTVEKLETERSELLERSSALERVKREHADRQRAIEQEINDLANLYIASFQLHATLSVERVVRHLADMMGQLIGAHGFVIYVVEGSQVLPIASEHVEDTSPLELGSGPVGEACLTGIRRIRESELERADRADPIAVLPLVADGKPVGAIELVSVLAQKSTWASVDHELFQLLGVHAGPALIAAYLYSQATGPVGALAGLSASLKETSESDG